MFLNLYFSPEQDFADHNLTDFPNEGFGGPRTVCIAARSLAEQLRASYEPDRRHPERLTGLDPAFLSVLPFTLSRRCFDRYLRLYPAQPVLWRDYEISKLYQFVFEVLVVRFELERTACSEFALELQSLFGQIPDRVLEPANIPRWAEFWYEFYLDTTTSPLEPVLERLRSRLALMLRPRRRPGPAPAEDAHAAVSAVLRQFADEGADWNSDLPRLCRLLDQSGVPCFSGRSRKERTSWKDKLASRGGADRIRKNIGYHLAKSANAELSHSG